VEYQVRPALPVPLTLCHAQIMIDDLNVLKKKKEKKYKSQTTGYLINMEYYY